LAGPVWVGRELPESRAFARHGVRHEGLGTTRRQTGAEDAGVVLEVVGRCDEFDETRAERSAID